jgi:hypothetical protein
MISPLGSTPLDLRLHQPHESTDQVEEIRMLLFYLLGVAAPSARTHVSHSLNYPLSPEQTQWRECLRIRLPLCLKAWLAPLREAKGQIERLSPRRAACCKQERPLILRAPNKTALCYSCKQYERTTRRQAMGPDRPAATAREAKAEGRTPSRARSCCSGRHSLRSPERDPLGDASQADGLRQRHDLLAPSSGLAESWRLGSPPPSLVGSTGPSRSH